MRVGGNTGIIVYIKYMSDYGFAEQPPLSDKHQLKTEVKVIKNSKNHIILLKQDWLNRAKKEIGKCQRAGCESCNELTLDHIVPKELILQFGIDEERTYMPENYQLYCRRCNNFKGNRLDFVNPITKEILLKLVQSL